MLNEIFPIEEKHRKAARAISEKIIENYKDKYIVTISGEVGCGKVAVAHVIAKLLRKGGICSKILKMDNYYKIPPKERIKWRKEHGIESVGYNEYDWETINKNIEEFKKGENAILPNVDLINGQVDKLHTNFKDINILIIDGLYSLKIDNVDFKVFVELTHRETVEMQLFTENEVLDEFRMKILEREHEVVMLLKPLADFYIDFDTSMEIFHL